jgi:hypothetical protein
MNWGITLRCVTGALAIALVVLFFDPPQRTQQRNGQSGHVLTVTITSHDRAKLILDSENNRNKSMNLSTLASAPSQVLGSMDFSAVSSWPLLFPPLTNVDTIEMQERLREYLAPVFRLPGLPSSTEPKVEDLRSKSAGGNKVSLSIAHDTNGAEEAHDNAAGAVGVEFLVCVRPWLYELLALRFAHLIPRFDIKCPRPANVSSLRLPPMRAKMGELRTWTSLLDALSQRLGCRVVLSKDCEELESWDHNITASSATGEERRAAPVNVLRAFLTEDLSLDWLKKVRGSTQQRLGASKSVSLCHRRARQTVAIAGQSSKFFDNQRVLPLFHIAEHHHSLGMVAECFHRGLRSRTPSSKHAASEEEDDGNGAAINVSTGAPTGPVKKWFAVLWGKTGQTGSKVRQAVEAVRKFIPVVSSCVGRAEHCDQALPTLKISNVTSAGVAVDVPATFAAAVRSAVLLIGPRAPERGAACPEALACGTYIVARGRNFGFEFAAHPLARRFRKQQDFANIVRDVLVHQWGFDEGDAFDRQPHPPDRRRAWAPLLRQQQQGDSSAQHHTGRPLPPRYSQEGYVDHIASLFGVVTPVGKHRGTCRVNALHHRGTLVVNRNGAVEVVDKRGDSPLQRRPLPFLLSTLSSVWDSWRWPGCSD